MHYYRDYTSESKTREEHDEQAIKDIKEWLESDEKFNLLVELSNDVCQGKTTVAALNFTMGFAGVSGYPFHAFCRRYCLEPYKKWLRCDKGGDYIEPDEKGFW